MTKDYFKKNVLFWVFALRAVFTPVCLSGMNTSYSIEKKKLFYQWNMKKHTLITCKPNEKISLITKLLSIIEPISQKERPLSIIWQKQEKKTQSQWVYEAFNIICVLQCGKFFTPQQCNYDFAHIAQTIKMYLTHTQMLEILGLLLANLWDNLDNAYRKKWCSSSLDLLWKFWEKFSPDEQMELLKTIITTRNSSLEGIKEFFKLLTPKQSKELIHLFLTGDLCYYNRLSNVSFTYQQFFFYCKELLTCKEAKLPLHFKSNTKHFATEIAKLDEQDRATIVNVMFTGKLSLNKKVVILNDLYKKVTTQEKNFYNAELLNLLKKRSGVECLKKKIALYNLDTIHQSIDHLILQKKHPGAKIVLLKACKMGDSLWYRNFNKAFDHSLSLEKCCLLKIFKEKFSKKPAAYWHYYLDRIKAECDNKDIQHYQELFTLSTIS